jgi:hypothetical protein
MTGATHKTKLDVAAIRHEMLYWCRIAMLLMAIWTTE